MSQDKFLKIDNGKVVLVSYYGNQIRTYYTKGDAVRVDWYNEKEESVQIQLANGKIVIVNKNGGIVKTV